MGHDSQIDKRARAFCLLVVKGNFTDKSALCSQQFKALFAQTLAGFFPDEPFDKPQLVEPDFEKSLIT